MESAWDDIPAVAPRRLVRIQHRDSIENKVLGFFDLNPGEELTVSDAVVKFNSEYIHMSKLFKLMFERGLLTRYRDGGAQTPWIYGAPAKVYA
jgi:hypothetical protein